MKKVNDLTTQELRNLVNEILHNVSDLTRKIDNELVIEDSDIGLYTKSILAKYGLLDKKLV